MNRSNAGHFDDEADDRTHIMTDFADRTIWTGDNPDIPRGHCNSVKGERPQEYLVARLRELGIAA